MKTLEFKYLALYLPHELRGKIVMRNGNLSGEMHITFEMLIGSDMEDIPTVNRGKIHVWNKDKYQIKPILRPLSDLTKEIEHNGKKFVPIEKLKKDLTHLNDKYPDWGLGKDLSLRVLSSEAFCFDFEEYFQIVQKLFEWHFDIHELIDEGLAIDINTIKE